MNLNAEQIAELLAGIARSQQAIIDAVESESGGWRNTHLLPKLNTASNMRLATPRLIDIPSRILLRSQGRVPMDVATIVRTIEEAVGGTAAEVPSAAVATTPVTVAPVAAAAVATAAVASATAASVPADPSNNDLGNFFDS
jgi:hypothetical protein